MVEIVKIIPNFTQNMALCQITEEFNLKNISK